MTMNYVFSAELKLLPPKVDKMKKKKIFFTLTHCENDEKVHKWN